MILDSCFSGTATRSEGESLLAKFADFGFRPTQPTKAVFFEKECEFILLQKGDIAIVFPEDAHMPQKRALVPTPVRKACVKVRLG